MKLHSICDISQLQENASHEICVLVKSARSKRHFLQAYANFVHEHHEGNQCSGVRPSFVAPQVFTIVDLAKKLYENILLSGDLEAHHLVLNDGLNLLLWREIGLESQHILKQHCPDVLSIDQLHSELRDAYQYDEHWSISDVLSQEDTHIETKDFLVYQAIKENYIGYLEENHLLDATQLLKVLCDYLSQNPKAILPLLEFQSVYLLGFDDISKDILIEVNEGLFVDNRTYPFLDMTKLERSFLTHIQNALSITYRIVRLPQVTPECHFRTYTTAEEEWRAAILWAQEEHQKDPSQRIALMSFHLGVEKVLVERLLRKYMGDTGWNMSMGRSLVDWPYVRGMMALLRYMVAVLQGESQHDRLLKHTVFSIDREQACTDEDVQCVLSLMLDVPREVLTDMLLNSRFFLSSQHYEQACALDALIRDRELLSCLSLGSYKPFVEQIKSKDYFIWSLYDFLKKLIHFLQGEFSSLILPEKSATYTSSSLYTAYMNTMIMFFHDVYAQWYEDQGFSYEDGLTIKQIAHRLDTVFKGMLELKHGYFCELSSSSLSDLENTRHVAFGLRAVLNMLQQFLMTNTFQPPERKGAFLDVLGPLEIMNGTWDRLWMLGMTEHNFPIPLKVTALIPGGICQYKSYFPFVDQHVLLQKAKIQKAYFLKSAPCVYISYAQQSGSEMISPSILFKEALLQAERSQLPPIKHRTTIEYQTIYDDQGLPLPVPKGRSLPYLSSSVFERYAKNPLWAYATDRLHIKPLKNYATGMSANQFGSFFHVVMEAFWEQCEQKGYTGLISKSAEERAALKRIAIDMAFRREKLDQYPHADALYDMYRKKADKILNAYFVSEELRQETNFEIMEIESERTCVFPSCFSIQLRLDRLDQVHTVEGDVSYAVIDYKTGKNTPKLAGAWSRQKGGVVVPRDLQLLLYGYAMKDTPYIPTHFIFYHMRPTEVRLEGLVSDHRLFFNQRKKKAPLKTFEKNKIDIEDLYVALERYAVEIARGDALCGFYAKDDGIYCDVMPFLRIEQKNKEEV